MAMQDRPGRRVSPAAIARVLHGIDFPKSKNEVVDYARQHLGGQTDTDLISILERLPDQQFKSMADIERSVGKLI